GNLLQHAFVPLAHQYSQALRIAGDYSNSVGALIGQAAGSPQAAGWGAQLQGAQAQIQSFLEAPPPNFAEPLAYDDPAFAAFGPPQGY
ncbi:MAG TPA: hypothetical protein PKZ08_11405, partial [Vicinamibacterales bacterium]|nr:hypothetical protein [Vicinamibacterales bacterium]